MQIKLSKLIILIVMAFVFANFLNEVTYTLNTPITNNEYVPNLDSNCYYSKSQVIGFFNDMNIEVVDIVKYSHNGSCAGKVVGSNLIPGSKIDNIQRVFITTNTSAKNIYFSYPILESILLLLFMTLLFVKKVNKKKLVIFFLIGITYLNFNSFLISSYRHNASSSRIFQFNNYSYENHLIYSDPVYFLKIFNSKND